MAKRGNYGKWSKTDLELALTAYRNGGKGLNQCSRDYNISKSTLLRHIRNTNKIAKDTTKSMGRNPTFDKEIENLLCERIVQFSDCFFGLTPRDIRKLAFDLAEKNHIPHQFNREKGIAGKKWYYKFMRRHSNLSLRQPESTSLNRIKGFNKENVNGFFDILENICDKHNINATSIFNMDESGFSTVAKKCQKVVTTKGTKAVASVASGERGVNTTIVCSVSAAGLYVPPMIIFKRKRFTAELGNGAPPGSKVEISESGYISSELFVKWLQHFVHAVHPTKENKVLLLLDGHTTHCKNLEALLLARENGVIMLQLPGHTTHRLQPLDRSFFKPLEAFYTQALEKWLRCNVGRTVTQYQVAELLGEAYGRAATVENAINGFRASGVWPVNRHVFKDSDFVPSETLKLNNIQADKNGATHNEKGSSSEDEDIPLSMLKRTQCSIPQRCSTPIVSNLGEASTSISSLLSVSLDEVAPLPKPDDNVPNKKARGIQKAAEITSSPYKDALEVKAAEKQKKGKKPTVPLKGFGKTISTTVTESNKWFCQECGEEEQSDMIQCMRCKAWIHCRCAGVTARKKKFYCESCTE